MRPRSILLAAAWALILLALGAGVYYTLFAPGAGKGLPDISPEAMQKSEFSDSPQEQSVDEQARGLKVGLDEAQITLSSGDGQLKMRMWATKGEKEGATYKVKDGVLQFALENKDTLILKVSDAEYRVEQDIAYVKGTLTGYLVGSQQFFSAAELAWDQQGKAVTAKKVTYTGPHAVVSGEEMQVDLATGEVHFKGPVEAGI